MFGRSLRILSALHSRQMREHLARTIECYDAMPAMQCPCCGYVGKFDNFGFPLRMGANCPSCESKERHRLFKLALDAGFLDFAGKSVLHFAPEPVVATIIRNANASRYQSADITPGRADLVLNIEAIDLPDSSVDCIICSHVLEHVDDAKALREMKRILTPGGFAAIMVPIIEGWDRTFEDDTLSSEAERERYFGQFDHVRYYGADLRGRITASGLHLTELTADGRNSPKFGLSRGEKIFRAEKTA